MSDEPGLRAQAREAIRSGKLPHRSAVRTFSGPGAGAVCEVCRGPVRPDEMEIELEFKGHLTGQSSISEVLERLRATSDGHRYHLHLRCFAAWEFERTKLEEPGQIQDRSI